MTESLRISKFTSDLMAASGYKPETVKDLLKNAEFNDLRLTRAQLYQYIRWNSEDSDWAQMLVDLVYEEIRNRTPLEPTMRVVQMDEDGEFKESEKTVGELHDVLFDILGD